VVFLLCSGVGSIPCAFKILPTVVSEIVCPRLAKAPWMRFIAPGRAFLRYTENQIDNGLGDRWPPDLPAAVAVIPFLRDEHPVPAQDRVGRYDRCNLSEYLTSEDLAFDCQASALVVIELDPLLAVRFAQDLVLGAQVLNNLLLLPVDPSGQDEKEKLPGM